MPEIIENVTERVNSKGEKTSMVACEVRETMRRRGWDFIGSGLTSGRLLLALVICVCGALVCASIGGMNAMGTEWTMLPGWRRRFRHLAGWLALIAFLLVPVFMMSNNLAFTRQIRLATDGFPTPELEGLLQRLDAFLYGGTAGEGTLDLMSGIDYRARWTAWALMPLLAVQVLGYVILAEGRPRKTLQRGALYAFVILLCVVILYPYYVMFITAFRSNAETTDMYFQHLLPVTWVWSNMRDIINRGVLRFLGNSLMLSFGATAIALLCGIPAAYAMARMSFRGKKIGRAHV